MGRQPGAVTVAVDLQQHIELSSLRQSEVGQKPCRIEAVKNQRQCHARLLQLGCLTEPVRCDRYAVEDVGEAVTREKPRFAQCRHGDGTWAFAGNAARDFETFVGIYM